MEDFNTSYNTQSFVFTAGQQITDAFQNNLNQINFKSHKITPTCILVFVSTLILKKSFRKNQHTFASLSHFQMKTIITNKENKHTTCTKIRAHWLTQTRTLSLSLSIHILPFCSFLTKLYPLFASFSVLFPLFFFL